MRVFVPGSVGVLLLSLPAAAPAGYSHYHAWARRPTAAELAPCLRAMDQVVQSRRGVLDVTRDRRPGTEAVGLSVNGLGPAAHEPFVFPGGAGFNSCKTLGKPYDEAVTACLIVARDFFPPDVLQIGSDGDWADDWRPGRRLYADVFGRAARSPLAGFGAEDPERDEIRPAPGGAMTHAVFAVLAAVFVAGLAVSFLRTRADFAVDVGPEHIRCHGRLALAQRAAVSAFLAETFGTGRRFTVRGERRPGGFRLSFRGDLSPAERQRIRNFFASDIR